MPLAAAVTEASRPEARKIWLTSHSVDIMQNSKSHSGRGVTSFRWRMRRVYVKYLDRIDTAITKKRAQALLPNPAGVVAG